MTARIARSVQTMDTAHLPLDAGPCPRYGSWYGNGDFCGSCVGGHSVIYRRTSKGCRGGSRGPVAGLGPGRHRRCNAPETALKQALNAVRCISTTVHVAGWVVGGKGVGGLGKAGKMGMFHGEQELSWHPSSLRHSPHWRSYGLDMGRHKASVMTWIRLTPRVRALWTEVLQLERARGQTACQVVGSTFERRREWLLKHLDPAAIEAALGPKPVKPAQPMPDLERASPFICDPPKPE